MSKKFIIIIFSVLLSFTRLFGQSGQDSPSLLDAEKWNTEAVALFNQRKYSEALPLAIKVVGVRKKELGKSDVLLGAAYSNLGFIYTRLDDKKGARRAFLNALEVFDRNTQLEPKDEKIFVSVIQEIAYEDAIEGNLQEAGKGFKRVIEIREKLNGKDASETASALMRLAEVYQLELNYELAEPLTSRALNIRTGDSNKIDEQSHAEYAALECLLTKLNKADDLKILRDRFYPKQLSSKSGDTDAALIKGGVMNGRAISLPRPTYPELARKRSISGVVPVQVLIDEDGKVTSACAISGPRELHLASEFAARLARFSPTTLSGRRVKVSGVITYNYSR